MPQLFDWGIVAPGTALRIKTFADSEAEAVDYKHVRYDGTRMTYYEWGKRVTGWSAINVYEWAIRHDAGKTLDELRREKMAQLAQAAIQTNENATLLDLEPGLV
jgi:hypothetical protein